MKSFWLNFAGTVVFSLAAIAATSVVSARVFDVGDICEPIYNSSGIFTQTCEVATAVCPAARPSCRPKATFATCACQVAIP